ncbi:MAG: hypothetical protein ACI89W_000583 [Gammaproteobacteria bacterium]
MKNSSNPTYAKIALDFSDISYNSDTSDTSDTKNNNDLNIEVNEAAGNSINAYQSGNK